MSGSRLPDIDFNGRFLARPSTGVDRFALETLRALDALLVAEPQRLRGRRLRLLMPPGVTMPQGLRVLQPTQVGRRGGLLWEQFELPWHSRGRLLVNLCNAAPLCRREQLVVIHDAATLRVPESFGKRFRQWYGVAMPWLYRRARLVATVSDFARRDLAAAHGPRADVALLPEGTEHMARLAADDGVLQRHGLGGRPYVLGVSSLAPHKNFRLLVDALPLLADLDIDVVVAGGQNPAVFVSAPLPPQVRHVGYVSDAELKALFSRAACFVFPSLYEGYGLPPTEAMACGCPVLAAQAASMPEVCGDAAIYFDPRDASALAAQLRRLLGDAALRADLRQRGLQRAATLSWTNSARALMALLDGNDQPA